MNVSEQITRDLMRKASDDTVSVLRRVLSIAPRPWLPIAAAAGAGCLGFVAAELEYMSEDGRKEGDTPYRDAVMLAGLLCAHLSIGGDDPIGAAYADLKTLEAARK